MSSTPPSGIEDAEHATLLKQGFAQVPSLVSASLCADIIANISMAKGQVISNALQQEVLATQCRDASRSVVRRI
jgi:hypothetical protein